MVLPINQASWQPVPSAGHCDSSSW